MTHLLSDTGLGILSWRGRETLVPVLRSLRSVEGMFEERVIYFNEMTDEDCDIAARFGFESFGVSENTGIYGGFRGLAESMKSRYVLLHENDMHLDEPVAEATRQLSASYGLLTSSRADVVQMIHLVRSGESEAEFSSVRKKYHRYYPASDSHLGTRLVGFLRRLFRPSGAYRAMGHAPLIYERPDESTNRIPPPESLFQKIECDDESGFYLLPSYCRRWTNTCFMVRRDFFIELLDFVERSPALSSINGYKNIENEVNASWWSRGNFVVAIANPGLFRHNRLGDRGY